MQLKAGSTRGWWSLDVSDVRRHAPLEDAYALVTGLMLVALGMAFIKQAGLATGGTSGIAFLLHYYSGWPLGLSFFLVNLPFYAFAVRGMGWPFALRTFIAVALLSIFVQVLPLVMTFAGVNPIFAAMAGGTLAGVGILVLIRHRASLGGVGVMAFYLQEKHGMNAGKVQMMVDAVVVLCAFLVLDPWHVALSILSIIALNIVLVLNHKSGRYMGGTM